MAGTGDAPARFPRQEVADGQKHSYIGDVDVYDPPKAGDSNTAADRAKSTTKTKGIAGTTGVVTDADVAAADQDADEG